MGGVDIPRTSRLPPVAEEHRAGVALPNPASLALHRACGFEEVATMRRVGRTFDRWIDLTWLQRILD